MFFKLIDENNRKRQWITLFKKDVNIYPKLGGSPGPVVMGDDSVSLGRGFESWRQIMNDTWTFSHWFVVKIALSVWKDQKSTKKRPGLSLLKDVKFYPKHDIVA